MVVDLRSLQRSHKMTEGALYYRPSHPPLPQRFAAGGLLRDGGEEVSEAGGIGDRGFHGILEDVNAVVVGGGGGGGHNDGEDLAVQPGEFRDAAEVVGGVERL